MLVEVAGKNVVWVVTLEFGDSGSELLLGGGDVGLVNVKNEKGGEARKGDFDDVQ